MRLLAVLAILGFVAVPALADRSSAPIYTATAVPLDTPDPGPRTVTNYSNMSFLGTGWVYYVTPLPQTYPTDDYDGVETAAQPLESIRFVGGVATSMDIIFWTFYTPGGTIGDMFGAQLPYVGLYIWTINITTPTDHYTPNDGYVQMWASNGAWGWPVSTGYWYADEAVPTIGTTAANPPNKPRPLGPVNMKLEINYVPEPATLALLGMGGLALIRRR